MDTEEKQMKPTLEQTNAWAREVELFEGSDEVVHAALSLAYEAGRKDENEACAEVCELMYDYGWLDAKRCAREIRARREQ